MLSHIATDLHKSYFEEVFKPQLGKPGASTPAKPTSSSDLDGDGNVDSFEKKVRQFIYDVRHLMRKNNIPVEKAFQIRSSKTNYGAEVIKTAKEKLDIKSGAVSPVSEEIKSGEKLFSIVINYRNGTTYRKRTSRSEISRLRSNPNISSVEMTKYGVDGLAKKDYDGDGKIESPSKEHAGVVHNAIQRKIGGTPDGKDTRKRTSKKKLKTYGVSEGFSNWRQDLKEVVGVDDEIDTRKKKEVTEKSVDNYKTKSVVINPEVTEEIVIFGGKIVESFEFDESHLNQVVNIASEFFYNSGLNENGVDIAIEELGEETFNEFVFTLAEEYLLSEARKSGRIDPITKSGKSIATLKGAAKASAIRAKQKEKKIRDKTDDKSSRMSDALRSQSEVSKKIKVDRVKKVTEKAKENQAQSNHPRKKSIQDRIAGFILNGIERDRASRETAAKLVGQTGQTLRKVSSVGSKAASEFAKGVKSGVKTTADVTKKTKKAVVGEEYVQEKAESEQQQKLFGLALSVKRGETSRDKASDEVLKIVDSMSEKKIRDFAKTKHSEVPKKVEEAIARVREGLPTETETKQRETAKIQTDNAKRRLGIGEDMDNGTPSLKELPLIKQKANIAKRLADLRQREVRKQKPQEPQNPQTQNKEL